MAKKNEDIKIGVNNNRKIIYIAAGAVGLIILIFLIASFFTNNSRNDYQVDVQQSETIVIEKVEKSLSGLTETENQEKVLETATTLLNLTNIVDGNEDMDQVVSFVENLDVSDLDMDRISQIVDFSGYSENDIISILQNLIIFSYMINASVGSVEIAPVLDSSEVVLKNSLGIAFVPLSIYTASDNAFNMMFVWDNNSWRLLPYPLTEQVKMLAYE